MERVRNSDPFRAGAARYQRKNPAKAEQVFWQLVRGKALGFRVRRQYACGDYILDFYIHAARLCIEMDGPLHDAASDRKRDYLLGERGILTHRIANDDLLGDTEGCLKEIQELCQARIAYLERCKLR